MPNANLSLQILPMVPQNQVYSVVDKVINLIQASGLPYVVGPMETTIEGDLDTLLDLVKTAQAICVEAGANRIVSIIKIDYSPDGVTIDEKISKYR
ncbi:MAG: thiamine-binding protein [Syntrophomonadaceae bacterium]|nr:thiamine-binding protein [Syntrophomonadaceae bacterium]MDD3272289.1 thiamine-binding protein [Syntrophomonadaceae bacterium]MDD3898266.1 thiamine-binding protein [Syntrophomonadaceae bacterium]MDD4562267.1 thiamine-binding protein [Syntrophomonadaceae bacterium]